MAVQRSACAGVGGGFDAIVVLCFSYMVVLVDGREKKPSPAAGLAITRFGTSPRPPSESQLEL